MKRIVRGNDFTLRIPVMKMVEGEKQPFPLPSCTDIVVRVTNSFKRTDLEYSIDVAEDNVILAKVEGDKMSLGTYAVEVKGKIFGADWRSNEYPQFQIVNNNADADYEFGEIDEGDNSVEMDTALVILPPTVELSNLISDTGKALEAVKETDKTLTDNEALRVDAEGKRVLAESYRVDAENVRQSNEDERIKNEDNRKEQESVRAANEESRVQAENEREEAEEHRIQNESDRIVADKAYNENEVLRERNEGVRNSNEAQRASQESARYQAEIVRSENEQERIKAETARKEAEAKREAATSSAISDMISRTDASIETMNTATNIVIAALDEHRTTFDEAEAKRVINESARQETEANRVSAESERQTSETARKEAEANRSSDFETLKTNADTATSNAQKAADDTNSTNASIKAEEEKRVSAESSRASAETKREQEEGIRQESETERIRKETERQTAEQGRVGAETSRTEKYEKLDATLAKTKADCEEATKAANDAASDATLAKTKAEEAATGAEKCNITMEGSTITVTDRDGNQTSVDVVDTDETVNLTITSSVDSIKVSGIKVNVFFNNDTKSPLQLTTDAEGKLSFTARRGEYYLMKFPEYSNAQPIAPVGYTAQLPSRDVTVEYVPYDEETSEKVIVKVMKYTDGTGAAWEGKEVKCTYDGKTTSYATDSTGQATIYVPLAKKYTVVVEDEDGYFVKFYNNKRTYTAEVTQRILLFNLYQFETGLYCVTADAQEYTIDKWLETGRDASEVVAIKIADQNLMLHRSTFALRTSDLKNMSALVKNQWCTQNLLFESIATNGNNSSDAYYWDGKGSTFLIRQEAQERSLSVPAADYANNQVFTLNDEDLNGFMLSVGQEYVHISNSEAIREILRKLYGDDVAEAYYKFVRGQWRWTSTQFGAASAWIYNSSANGGTKTASYYVLPAYAC